MSDLRTKRCRPCQGGGGRLDPSRIGELLREVSGWEYDEAKREIRRDFRFADFFQTIGFVNALAWVANQENHHPDLEAGYNYCRVRLTTHDAGGVTENDFICAAKIEALLRPD